MSNYLFVSGDSGSVHMFSYDDETFAVNDDLGLEVKRNEPVYSEDLEALCQLLHDAYGTPDRDGQMFEIVAVPDDVALSAEK